MIVFQVKLILKIKDVLTQIKRPCHCRLLKVKLSEVISPVKTTQSIELWYKNKIRWIEQVLEYI